MMKIIGNNHRLGLIEHPTEMKESQRAQCRAEVFAEYNVVRRLEGCECEGSNHQPQRTALTKLLQDFRSGKVDGSAEGLCA